MRLLAVIIVAWQQWRCKHKWRPAVYYVRGTGKHVAAKACKACLKTVLISDDDFYSQFGEMVQQVIAQREGR